MLWAHNLKDFPFKTIVKTNSVVKTTQTFIQVSSQTYQATFVILFSLVSIRSLLIDSRLYAITDIAAGYSCALRHQSICFTHHAIHRYPAADNDDDIDKKFTASCGSIYECIHIYNMLYNYVYMYVWYLYYLSLL